MLRQTLFLGLLISGICAAPAIAQDASPPTVPAADTTIDDGGFNMGWLGLIGLAGLAGLMGRNRQDRVATHAR